jgi:hypothetical protein
MSLRIEILEGGTIEIMRAYVRKERNFAHKIPPDRLGEAMFLIRHYLVEDLEAAEAGRFVSQLEKDAKKAYITLNQRSPFYGKKK